jgi:hypothetical protein
MIEEIDEIDEIIINLNIIANIIPNKKLIVREQLINFEKTVSKKCNLLQSITRWFKGESRHSTLIKIDKIITNAGKLINTYTDKITKNNYKFSDNYKLYNYIKLSKYGLKNLRDTYLNCYQTSARIEIIMFKIDYICDEFEKNIILKNITDINDMNDLNIN